MRYLTGIEKHLARWHTRVLIDTMEPEEEAKSKNELVLRDFSSKRKSFISIQGEWHLCSHLHDWLKEMDIEYIISLNSTVEPYEWSVVFEDKGQAALFKLAWGGLV
jgi:hypothetical protein